VYREEDFTAKSAKFAEIFWNFFALSAFSAVEKSLSLIRSNYSAYETLKV